MQSTTDQIQLGKSQATYKRAKEIIPGGTQLLSKRPEMFLPDLWPAYYDKAKGCQVWDLDGKSYIDAAYMGVGANLLGYANDTVDQAVIDAIRKGTNTTLNAPEEVELAELLLDLHPWADMVRYTKTGGEAMSVAVRIARASTGRDKVLFCGYHGWHDWYISSNLSDDKLGDGHLLPGLEPSGVPRQLLGTAAPFTYNDVEGFLNLVSEHGDSTACIVIESIRSVEPTPEFIKVVREEATKRGIVLIIDEITAGFRMNMGGAHLRFGIQPDIAVFGKAFTNGYPLSAVIGKKSVMDAAQSSFISSLFWTERTGLAAALATIREMQRIDSPTTITKLGSEIKKRWAEISSSTGIGLSIAGTASVPTFGLQVDDVLATKTFFTQEMLKRGFLASTAFYVSCAHEGHTDSYLNAMHEVMSDIKSHLNSGRAMAEQLQGQVCHSGFKRLT